MNRRVSPKVLDAIRPKGSELVRFRPFSKVAASPCSSTHTLFSNFSIAFRKVLFQKVNAFKFRNFTLLEKTNTGKIQVDASLNSPASRFAHSPPILERITHQGMGGNGGNGFIPILNLDRGQSNIDDASVRPVFGISTQSPLRTMLFAAIDPCN